MNTIANKRIVEIAKAVAKTELKNVAISDVLTTPTVDSVGRDALRITIVVGPNATDKIDGDAALDTLAQIQDRLRREGEERLPIVEYATQKELEESGSS